MDAKKNSVLLTKDGLAALEKELNELKNVKLPEVVERVSQARGDGDLSENSAYQFGRQEQEYLEGRIEELETIINNATFVAQEPSNGKGLVDIGCKVTVHAGGKKQTYHVVGDWEAKPGERKISSSSPLGSALLGKKVGDKVEIEAPAGKIQYTILEVE